MPFRVGDTVKVHVIIREGDKERIQIFRGDVIGRRGGGVKATFTVRKVSFGSRRRARLPASTPR